MESATPAHLYGRAVVLTAFSASLTMATKTKQMKLGLVIRHGMVIDRIGKR